MLLLEDLQDILDLMQVEPPLLTPQGQGEEGQPK